MVFALRAELIAQRRAAGQRISHLAEGALDGSIFCTAPPRCRGSPSPDRGCPGCARHRRAAGSAAAQSSRSRWSGLKSWSQVAMLRRAAGQRDARKKAARRAPMFALAAIAVARSGADVGRRSSTSEGRPSGDDVSANPAEASTGGSVAALDRQRLADQQHQRGSSSARADVASGLRAGRAAIRPWRRSSSELAPWPKRSFTRRVDSSRWRASGASVRAAHRRTPARCAQASHRGDQADLHRLAGLLAGEHLGAAASLRLCRRPNRSIS